MLSGHWLLDHVVNEKPCGQRQDDGCYQLGCCIAGDDKGSGGIPVDGLKLRELLTNYS